MARPGDILPRRPIAERLWEKVDKSAGPEGCWIWTGGRRNTFGYGEIWSGGNEGRPLVTHRVAWEVTHGPVPAGMCLDHICKNPACCNPKHLRVVTPRQNYVDFSDSPHGKNGRKTHCVRGHPFAGENLVRFLVRSKNKRRWVRTRGCLTCNPGLVNHPRRFWLVEDLASSNEFTQESKNG